MAKSKKTVKSNKKKVDQEILTVIYSLLCITLSIIGILDLGLIGHILMRFMDYLFGFLGNLVFISLIFVSCLLLFKKSLGFVKPATWIGSGCFLLAWSIFIAIPADRTIEGMQVFMNYVSSTKDILTDTLIGNVGHGGIVGAFLYGCLSALFGYMGTMIFLIALILMGLFLLLSSQRINAALHSFISVIKKMFASLFKKKERKPRKKKEKTYDDEVLNYEEDQTKFDFSSLELADSEHSDLLFDDQLNVQETNGNSMPVLDIDSTANQNQVADTKTDSDKTKQESTTFLVDYSKYKVPGISLLNLPGKDNNSKNNKIAAAEAGEQLVRILDEFGVKATLVDTHIGPSVTKFEIKPDLGVKVSKISNLQNDIKLALAAKDIRIEAPIPSKSAVGIEIPNVDKTLVSLRELLRNVPEKYKNSKLLFALGKDLLGQPVYGELNKMPHLLIAGATGSGKSVCVNSIIVSLLMRAKPDEVKMLLIDPKKVEFTSYAQIPHLIGPIINDGEEASRALKVIVNEMDSRYDLFSQAGVRNIAGYNDYIKNHPEEGLTPLPWIVVIIDELADLMLVAAKDVEASIQRITQLARAAGIHLIVATQRPSVDVITGIIKANIPSRIAFAVSSAVDSRTILDQQGAEKLLGMGDMLYMPIGEQNVTRVQGVYVSDDEVNRVCEAVSKQGHPMFNDAFIRLQMLDGGVGTAGNNTSDDPLYEEAKQFIIESQKASTSLIQRKYSIGYQRAARLIDMMEENGVVGPSRGSKPREVYMKNNSNEQE